MFRILPYIALFLAAVLSQIFIFDGLSTSVLLAPLVYVVFILLLPIETPQILMLSLGVAMGLIMDATMGTAGLNSISTIFIAYFRAPILRSIIGGKRLSDRGVPSHILLGNSGYMRYLIIMILIHHTIFFLFEALTFAHILYMLIRLVFSSSVTLLFVWLIARLFSINNTLK